MIFEQIKEKLKKNLTDEKYFHSICVMEAAVELAEVYGADREKAKIAGLVHDCAKCMTNEKLLKMAEDFGIFIDDIFIADPGILHASVGAEIAKREYKIEDSEILLAIKNHTTGAEGMSLLEKIIYIADYISKDRDFEGVDMLRKKARENLDEGVISGMDSTINHVIDKGKLIHPTTINARNYLIKNKKHI